MTKTAREWEFKKKIWERQKNLWTVNLSFRNWEARLLPEDIQQVNSVASKYGVQLVPNEAYLDGDWNTRAFSVYENSDLIKPNLSPLLGECATLLLFLCYDIHDPVGVSDWLVRQWFSSYFLVRSNSINMGNNPPGNNKQPILFLFIYFCQSP